MANTLQICDIISYQGGASEPHTYRVRSFLKQWTPPPLNEDELALMELLDDDIDTPKEIKLPPRIALVRCTPEEAEFVSASGVCGIVAPLTHVQRIGCASWDEDMIREERERYAKLDPDRAQNRPVFIDDHWGFLKSRQTS